MQASRTRTRPGVTMAVLGIGVSAYTMLQSMVAPVLSTLQAAFHTSQADVAWVLTVYLLSAAVATPILGRLGDKYGKKRMFVVSLSALAVGALLAALATSLPLMIVARVVQGIGGGVLPLSIGIISDEFPTNRIPGSVGLISAIAAVGGSAGLVLAGPIAETLDYHWLFWISLMLTGVAATAAQLVLRASPTNATGRLNPAPVVLLSAWLIVFLLAISEAPSWGWGSTREIGLLLASGVLVVGWVMVESRVASPLVDMRMMRRRGVWTNNLVALLLGFGMYTCLAYVPSFVQTPRSAGYGFSSSVSESGVMILPQSLLAFVCGVFAGRIASRIGLKNLLLIGAIACALSFGMLAELHDQKWQIYVSMAVLGVGIGCAFSAMSSLIVSAVPADQTGVAAGMNANIRIIGGAIGAAAMATIVTSGASADGIPRVSGYEGGFLMLAGTSALGALATVLIPTVRRRTGGVVVETTVGIGLVSARAGRAT